MTGARILGAEDFVSMGLAEPGRLREIRRVAEQFAVAVTEDVAELIDPADPADPIAAQFVPTAAELTEAPEYFLKEAVQERQMNFLELQRYIADLQQSGLVDTRKLQVQYYLKFANPLFALIMAIRMPIGCAL